jgi:hypothetical protein
LLGATGARLFRRGESPEDLAPNTQLDALLLESRSAAQA